MKETNPTSKILSRRRIGSSKKGKEILKNKAIGKNMMEVNKNWKKRIREGFDRSPRKRRGKQSFNVYNSESQTSSSLHEGMLLDVQVEESRISSEVVSVEVAKQPCREQ